MRGRLGLTIVLVIWLAASLKAQDMDEYRVKAAFLYNFAKFVDWPADTLGNPGEAFAICVLGQDPFGRALDDVVAGKTIEERPLSVRRISDVRQAGGCRILFVSTAEGNRGLAGLAGARLPMLLTVSEAGRSASKDAVINFTLQGGKVRFEINMVAADERKIHLSSRLLSLATAVRR